MELQTIGILFEDISHNILADGSPSKLPQIYFDLIDFLSKDVLDDTPELDGLIQSDSNTPIHRIMWAHGTRENDKRFVLLEAGINVAKESVR